MRSSEQRGNVFRNDPQTRATERALVRPLKLGNLWTDDGTPVFAFKYYRDASGGAVSSGERTLLLSSPDLRNDSGEESADTVDVEALSRMVYLAEFLEGGS